MRNRKAAYQMTIEEIELLEQVKEFGNYSELGRFFNRNNSIIRKHILKLRNKKPELIYDRANIHQK